VRCTFAKQVRQLMGAKYKGQRPVILVEQMRNALLKGAAHRNLLPVLSCASKLHTGFTPIGRSF